ncbi:uncharacterized protein PF11_0207 isoform X2 [Cephus cinctus]|nr:uncharacterized protein PF11_0207 isoform X2 [Cephus cinctus]XP_024936589.1 uncharacterized protein PF11_0207 isoform X2 [Cephus cinctus]
MKKQEDLLSDLISLKRQLTTTLRENQLFKINIHKLQSNIYKKDKEIEYLERLKNREIGSKLNDRESDTVLKLLKRNEELEEMFRKIEMKKQKRYKEMKMMCLYGRPNFKKKSEFVAKKTSYVNMEEKNKLYSEIEKLSTAIKGLERERKQDKRQIRLTNAEILHLRMELKKSKELNKQNEITRSGSLPMESTCSSIQKLEVVKEKSEDSEVELSSDIINRKPLLPVPSNKTKIEYVYDSEVSSDGEDIYLSNHLRSFLQQVVIAVSSEADDD